MGIFKAFASLVNKRAWGEQYVENFLHLVHRAEQQYPNYPRCCQLGWAWRLQFEIPGCPVPSFLAHPAYTALLGSFYSCLDKPNDSEALALHAVAQARTDIFWNEGSSAKNRFILIARPVYEPLIKKDYAALKQRFLEKNPDGYDYCLGNKTGSGIESPYLIKDLEAVGQGGYGLYHFGVQQRDITASSFPVVIMEDVFKYNVFES